MAPNPWLRNYKVLLRLEAEPVDARREPIRLRRWRAPIRRLLQSTGSATKREHVIFVF